MLFLPAFILLRQAPDLKSLDALAQARNVDKLSQFLTPDSLRPMNPLQVLKTNGAYETGRLGWHALELAPPNSNQSYVVFATPITSEDVGEMIFQRIGAALKYVPEDDPLAVRIVRHHLDVRFDIPKKSISVVDDVDLKKLPDSRPYYFIRMSPYLKVESVTEKGKPVPFTQTSGVTAISAFAGQTATVTVKYSGVVDQPQYAGSIVDGEAQLSNDYWYPTISRWPAPYDITVHTPKGWLAIGQGEQVSMNEDASGRTTKFRMDMPVTYYSLSTAPYKTASQMDGKLKISAWGLARSDEQLKQQTDLYKPILEYYDKNFSPFPFSGYGALYSQLYGGGALEAYSFATYGFGVPSEDAHEPSHTWWGGAIDNTYLHSMWNESFANFCEGLYARNVPLGNHQERQLAFIKDAKVDQDYLVASCEDASPWYGGPASSIGYEKGSKVLQMFETEIGTDMMIKTMQQWLKENPKGEPGEWSGYEKAVANATHKDYDWFFDEWLRRKGWADFEVKNVQWNKGVLTGDVYFTGEAYRINCEMLLLYSENRQVFRKFDTMQKLNGKHYTFSLSVPYRPLLVSIDPWRRVLRTQHADETPPQLTEMLRRSHRYNDPKHADWLKGVGGTSLAAIPQDLDNVLLVGTPDTIPQMALLCGKAGFIVRGDKLTYDNSTIDLNNGGALAVVDLPGGKHCIVGLGKVKLRPDTGRARTDVFDSYGRFLRGYTEPKTSGWMTFKIAATSDKKPTQGHVIK